MSRQKRYIRPLSEEEVAELEAGHKSKKGQGFQQRCHAILLSHKGYDIPTICDILGRSNDIVYVWFNHYEKEGISRLKTQAGQGRKPLLSINNKDHVKAVEKAVKKSNEKGVNLLAEIDAQLGLNDGLSMRMLRTFLKKTITSGNELEDVLSKALQTKK